jgi:aminoglycoside phosphotransferase (APT) family kinase protein
MKQVRAGGVPAPEVFVLERDTGYLGRPFIIMEKVGGETLGDVGMRESQGDPSWKNSSEAAEWIDKFAALLASVHRLDLEALGLEFISANPWALDENALFLQRLPSFQMESLDELYRLMADWIHDAIREARNQDWSLIHYDFHFENILVNNDRIVALLDWCEARKGDAAFDVAWTSLILFDTGEEELIDPFVSAYRRHSRSELENLAAYEVLAGLRQLSDLLILKEAGAHASEKRPDAAGLFNINEDVRKAAEFIQRRTAIDLSFFYG